MWTWRRPLQKLWSCSGLFTGFVTLQMQFIPLTVEGTTCCFIRLTTVKQHNQQVATSWTLRRGYFLSPWHLWRVAACPHYVVAMLLRLLYRIQGAVVFVSTGLPKITRLSCSASSWTKTAFISTFTSEKPAQNMSSSAMQLKTLPIMMQWTL